MTVAVPETISTFPSFDLQQRHAAEPTTRRRAEANGQSDEHVGSHGFARIRNDPWADHEALNVKKPSLNDGSECKFLILGAGYGGLFFAVRLIQAGFQAEDIRLVDAAGGFGGTWYWNRYPGLMCDVESYIYMPLLEETGYIPKHKYAYGPELREQADRIADMWNLQDKATFRAEARSQRWDENRRNWVVNIREYRGPSQPARTLEVRAQFVILATGVLNIPQVPKSLEHHKFEGSVFHTSRWDYNVTGGTPQDPQLTKLANKRVGIIGTGSTAVQVVPHLAKWAKELYVFQRTPTACGFRGQQETDPVRWRAITSQRGWQRARAENFTSYLSGAPDGEDLVQDGWTSMPAFQALLGSPGIVSPEKTDEHVSRLLALDAPWKKGMHSRADEIVKDQETAEKLKTRYPGWCKRPTFHDDYLQVFNQPNVKLIDAAGVGVGPVTKCGVIHNGVEYPVDVLVLSTGYLTALAEHGSPAYNSSITITGCGGVDLDSRWKSNGATSLHGYAFHGFPNCFVGFPTSQAGLGPNATYMLDMMSSHITQIISEAHKTGSQSLVIQPTREAEEWWASEVVKRATWYSAMATCINVDGVSQASEKSESEKIKSARAQLWGEGIVSYVAHLKSWREEGMKGLEILV